MIGLRDITGLWRRTLIAWPDGRTDRETDVFWLQGLRLYADLRIPAARPGRPDVACLRELDSTMLRFMARQEGFFGGLDVVDSVATWQRAFDLQPETGVADRGQLAFEEGVLVERGLETPYVEHWVRQCGADDVMALSLAAATGALGCLIVAGDAFMYARARGLPLPRATALDRLIDDADSLEAAQDLFDCEISLGRRQADDEGDGWRIERSSLCFREGSTLAAQLNGSGDALVVTDVTPEGTPFNRAWRITDYESSLAAPLARWFARPAAPCPAREPALMQK